MNDGLDRLEQQLAAMRPRAVPQALTERISARLAPVPARPWADRCLCCAMSAGAAAACVIVAMLLVQASGSPAPSGTMIVQTEPKGPADYPTAFARVDAGLMRRADLNN